eukprot:GEMP01136131.1.p1 GENE.GEMP01136131.1~~GEMP01136131.1.p1  ORF type:complete len:128 (-),score=4.66 GEMP01136131.1:21-404(-)
MIGIIDVMPVFTRKMNCNATYQHKLKCCPPHAPRFLIIGNNQIWKKMANAKSLSIIMRGPASPASEDGSWVQGYQIKVLDNEFATRLGCSPDAGCQKVHRCEEQQLPPSTLGRSLIYCFLKLAGLLL